ncbi:hypothetical protein [Sphingomonas sp. PP-CE-1A-559]|uniref:hypothetical protein n=1 Tax=Sphingomonas sp. PP-CE-1A-559 TaxID=2135657 RepID=UPI0010553E93|nr:hypothetical protein [Sphingomonas sp. PP-CE-1A-559]
MIKKADVYERVLTRIEAWVEESGSIAFAFLFWSVAIMLAIATTAAHSLDLFIKAFTGVATAGVALAVWRSTRAFQRASVETANKKLRLDLFKERLPLWEAFKPIRGEIVSNGKISRDNMAKLINLSRDAQVLLPPGDIHRMFEKYVSLASDIHENSVRGFGNVIEAEEVKRIYALQQIRPLGVDLGDAIVHAIRITDL